VSHQQQRLQQQGEEASSSSSSSKRKRGLAQHSGGGGCLVWALPSQSSRGSEPLIRCQLCQLKCVCEGPLIVHGRVGLCSGWWNRGQLFQQAVCGARRLHDRPGALPCCCAAGPSVCNVWPASVSWCWVAP